MLDWFGFGFGLKNFLNSTPPPHGGVIRSSPALVVDQPHFKILRYGHVVENLLEKTILKIFDISREMGDRVI